MSKCTQNADLFFQRYEKLKTEKWVNVHTKIMLYNDILPLRINGTYSNTSGLYYLLVQQWQTLDFITALGENFNCHVHSSHSSENMGFQVWKFKMFFLIRYYFIILSRSFQFSNPSANNICFQLHQESVKIFQLRK